MSWFRAPLLLFLVVGLLLSACGDDDDDADTAGPEPTETTEGATDDAETTEGTEGTGDPGGSTTTEDSTTTTEDATTTEAPVEGAEAFCAELAEFEQLASELPDETLEQLQDGAAQLVPIFEEAVAVAPAEIADDAETLLGALEEVKVTVDEAASLEDAQSQIADNPEAEAAADRLQQFSGASCPA